MSELSQIEGAYRSLQDKDRKPNFLFIAGGLSDVSQFDSFALFARDLDIDLCGIIYDAFSEGGADEFGETYILVIGPDEYELVRKADELGSDNSNLLHALGEIVRGCFVKLPTRFASVDGLRLECVGEIDDPFFLIYPKCGPIPSYALAFLATIEQRNVIHIVLEEGIGSYLMTFRDWWFLGVSREMNPLTRTLKSIVLHLLWPLKKRQQSRVDRAISSVSFTLFKEGSALQKNETPCRYYKRALEDIAAQRRVKALDFSDTVIIATTRFADFDAIDFETSCLGVVISILQKHGYRVILRPHPAEKLLEHYKSLPVEMDSHMDVSLETQIAASQSLPAAILGFMSSAQLISNALWGVEAICLSDVLSDEWQALASENGAIGLLNREIQDAKRLFEGYIEFPHGPLQLESEIVSLGEERLTSI